MNFSKLGYISKWYMRQIITKITKKELEHELYPDTVSLSIDEANKCIAKAINSNIPFMAGRFGANELNVAWRANEAHSRWDVSANKAMYHLHHGAGFFPQDNTLGLKFAKEMQEATKQVDLLAVWNRPMEDYFIKCWAKKPLGVCSLRGIEPFFSNEPWTTALEGKRVLIIHPFNETIQFQYEKRKLLFKRKDLLPDFQLITQKAVQTIAGNKDDRFETWFDALDFMYAEAMKNEFDVAILGCGAYGFPLAAKLKQAGKVVIHMGGSTQLLFGIRGKRWDENPAYVNLPNEWWVRASEQPQNARTVEDGCYW